MALVNNILVPVDFSACSLSALAYATTLAADLGARVAVLHVLSDQELAESPDRPSAQLERARAQMAEAVAEPVERLGERLTTFTELGDPLSRIVEAAISDAHDLIVMGTHGRIGRLHMLAGSLAESVVRNAPCPVVTVRIATGARESFAERLRGESHFEARVGS